MSPVRSILTTLVAFTALTACGIEEADPARRSPDEAGDPSADPGRADPGQGDPGRGDRGAPLPGQETPPPGEDPGGAPAPEPMPEPEPMPGPDECQADADCGPGGFCEMYASCAGLDCPPPPPNECVYPDCDDDTQLLCEIEPPECPEGTISAVQGTCFACVDPRTCEPLHDDVDPEPEPEPMPGGDPEGDGCFIGGCSGQICSDQPNVGSTCEWLEEYACYQHSTCERQADGACGWTPSPALVACLDIEIDDEGEE